MPLLRISFKRSRSPEFRHAVADGVHRVMMETIAVPEGDRFQILTEHEGDLVYDPHYLGIERSDGIVIIQITMAAGRSLERKKALFRRIAELLSAEQGLRPQDIFVNLVEVARENWSFGNGIAQYADAPPPHLAASS
jgi:4-oxalocrotonate tautomerase